MNADDDSTRLFSDMSGDAGDAAAGYSIPPPPSPSLAQWIPRGVAVDVAGLTIGGGMVYVGERLPSRYGSVDPALVDPRKSVDLGAMYTQCDSGAWPNYSNASPRVRGAYLRWLADGRSSPEADIAYIWLFFYGLERRILIDASADRSIASEFAHIAKELQRLLKHYGTKSPAFSTQCNALLDFLMLFTSPARLYEQAIPAFPAEAGFPIYLRLAIGQAIADKQAVPAELAWAWVQCDPDLILGTAASRCPDEFRSLFLARYRRAHGDGLTILGSRRKLGFTYFPASHGLRDEIGISLDIGDIPDVSVLSGPVTALQDVIDACTADLDAYQRLLERKPEAAGSLEALVCLPYAIWPAQALQVMTDLKARVAGAVLILPLQQLTSRLGAASAINSDILCSLANVLVQQRIAIEPDVLSAAHPQWAGDTVVLYDMLPGLPDVAEPKLVAAYDTALFSLELLSALAQMDGAFSEDKLALLDRHIGAWSQFTPTRQLRLKARVRLLLFEPLTMVALLRKIAALDQARRDAAANLIVTMAQDGANLMPEEVAILGRIVTLLGSDRARMDEQVHAMFGAPMIETEAEQPSGGLKLDLARIAELQQDSAKVAALLGNIFSDEREHEAPAPPPVPEMSAEESALPGLDTLHSTFARKLLARAAWPRGELETMAAQLDIMLDGALERINEASLDAFDMPCTEGDDPIEINPEIHERIAA